MSSSLTRRCVAAATSLLVVTAGSWAAQASPSWVSDVVDLSSPERYAQSPQVALDGSGNAVAAWAQQTDTAYVIKAATRPTGGTWSSAATLSDGTRIAGEPQVSVTPDGDALVVWQHNAAGSSVIQSSSWSVGGRWTDPVDVSTDGGFAVEPRLALDPEGTAVAVWHRNGVAQASIGTVDGSWRKPVALSGSGDADSVRVAAGLDAAPVAAWRALDGGVSRIVSATLGASGWSRPVPLSDGVQDVQTPEVAVDARGDAVAAWSQFSIATGAPSTIRATYRTLEGAWAPASTVSDPSRGAFNPDVAVNPSGEAVVAWDIAGGPDIRVVQAATTSPGDRSWVTRSLSDPTHLAVEPGIAFGSGGTAVVIWSEATSFGLPTLLHASTRAPGQSWSAPDDLSDPEVQPIGPQVTVDRDGNALAVWQGANGTGGGVIQSRGFDGVGPAVSAFRPARRGAVQSPLRYSARARDAWSGVRKVVWTFGDGHRATGRTVLHRYRRPGVYRVRITTSDRLGNVSVKRARTRVTRR